MPLSKTFETLFRINAKWIGGPGVAKAQAALQKTAASAQRVNVRLKGMATSVFAGAAAYGVLSRAVGGAINILQRSVTAAGDVQEAHDNLSLSMERNAKHYSGLAGKSIPEVNRIIAENVQMLIQQSEQMEKTGHDAETLQAGWDKMIGARALTPKQISEQRKGFSDILSYMYGANATQEESVELGAMWSDLILQGNQALAKRLDLSQGQLLRLRKINMAVRKGEITAEEGIKRRQAFMVEAAETMAGETERVFEKPSGKVAQMWTQVENIFVNLGKPFIDRAPEMATAFSSIATSIQPVAQELAKIVDVHLKGLSDWLAANKTELPERLATIVSWLQRIQSIWDKINEIKNTPFTKLMDLWSKGWGEPTRMAQLPGAPTQAPIAGGAGTGGEAARRNAEAQAKAAAAAGFAYGEGYPSALPPKINVPPTTSARAIPTTKYSKGGRFGPDEMTDPWTEKGYTSSGPNLSPGVVAVNTSRYPLGTVFQDENTGKVYVAADRHGNVNKNVVDVFRTAGTYGSGYKENLKVIGKMGKVPGTREGLQEALSKYGTPPSASLRDTTSGLGRAGGGGGPTNNISMSSPITVNGVSGGREHQVARQVQTAIRDPIRQLLDQIKAARNYESRLGYV